MNKKSDYWMCVKMVDGDCDSEYLGSACRGCYRKEKKECSDCGFYDQCENCIRNKE